MWAVKKGLRKCRPRTALCKNHRLALHKAVVLVVFFMI